VCTDSLCSYDSTKIAAVGTWEILQAFLAELPTLDSTITNLTFNLWTESYGGHYGPQFYDYFYEQNELISSGQQQGVALRMVFSPGHNLNTKHALSRLT
jgi:hypothetical protein